MTTSNEIKVYTHEDVLFVPLEAVYSDSLTYVYKKSGNRLVKQEVITGPASSNHIVIAHGLEAGEEVLISLPKDNEEYDFYPLDPNIKEAIRLRLQEELAERMREARQKEEAVKDVEVPQRSGSGDDMIIIIN